MGHIHICVREETNPFQLTSLEAHSRWCDFSLVPKYGNSCKTDLLMDIVLFLFKEVLILFVKNITPRQKMEVRRNNGTWIDFNGEHWFKCTELRAWS